MMRATVVLMVSLALVGCQSMPTIPGLNTRSDFARWGELNKGEKIHYVVWTTLVVAAAWWAYKGSRNIGENPCPAGITCSNGDPDNDPFDPFCVNGIDQRTGADC